MQSTEKLKVLLTGAAGSVGYETLKQLITAKCEVTAFDIKSRRNKHKLRKYAKRATIRYGDIRDRALVDELVAGQDVVIHLAAMIPPAADWLPALARDVNYGGSQDVVDAIRADGNRAFLVYTSSISIYGDRTKNFWIKVGDRLRPSEGDFYARTKIDSEHYIERSGVHYTIFRLTAIMNRPQTDPLMFHMPLDTKLEIATVYDTARALVAATRATKVLDGHIYNLGGGPSCRTTYREFLVKMFQIYGLQYRYLKSRAFALQNFHCGYYEDSDVLEQILHFQKDSLTDYYQKVRQGTNKFVRFLSRIFSRPIIYFLTKKSEPLQAKKKRDRKLIARFFGGEEK